MTLILSITAFLILIERSKTKRNRQNRLYVTVFALRRSICDKFCHLSEIRSLIALFFVTVQQFLFALH